MKILYSLRNNILQALSGLMKVNKGDFNYELDLLLTDKPTQYFINCIDFDICNLKITLIDITSHGYHYIPSIEHISERFYGSFQFFNDVMIELPCPKGKQLQVYDLSYMDSCFVGNSLRLLRNSFL